MRRGHQNESHEPCAESVRMPVVSNQGCVPVFQDVPKSLALSFLIFATLQNNVAFGRSIFAVRGICFFPTVIDAIGATL